MPKYFSIPRSGLVGEWLLDGNANDTNDGTKTNGTATNVVYTPSDRGYQKQRAIFNGSSSGVTIDGASPAGITFSQFGSAFSMVCNIFESSQGSNKVFIGMQVSNGSARRNMYLNSNSGNIRVNVYDGTVSNYNSSLTIATGKHYHIVLTYDGTTIKVYADNQEILSQNRSLSQQNDSQAGGFGIGCERQNGANNNFFNGNVGGARTYSRVLTETERTQLFHEFNRKLGGGSDFGAYIPAPTMMWDYMGDANDVASQTYNGTASGTAAITTGAFGEANGGATATTDSSRFTLPNSSPTIGDVTIATLFKGTTTPTGSKCLDSYLYYAGTPACALRVGNNWNANSAGDKVDFLIRDAGGTLTECIKTTAGVLDGSLHSLIGVRSGTTFNLYIDGALAATTTGTGNALSATPTSHAICWNSGSISGWNVYQTLRIDRAIDANQAKFLSSLMKSGRYPYAFRRSIIQNTQKSLRIWYPGITSGTTAYDLSGNGNNGTIQGSPTIIRAQQSSCFNLNGSSQYIDGPTFDPGNDFAVSCWWKPSNVSNEQVFASNSIGSGSTLKGFFFLYDNSNKLRLTEYNTGFSNRDLYTPTMTFAAGKWYFVTAVIRGGTNYEIYVGDSLVATQSGTDKTSINAAWRFGCYGYTVASTCSGGFEPFVWNTSPSAEQIRQLYFATYRN